MYKGKVVLLPEASSRQVLPMAKALKRLGCKIITVQSNNFDLGNVTKYADKKIVINAVDNNYSIAKQFYKELLENNKIDLVIPLSDFSAEIFSELQEIFDGRLNTIIAVNKREVFLKAFDKFHTMKICMENKIPCPYTLDEISSIDDVAENIFYPVILKPRSSCGSIGIHIAHNRNELDQYIKQTKDEKLGDVLVQEFIPPGGKQYNAHFVMDKQSNIKSAVITEKCRWFPLDGGASTLCRTIKNDYIVQICTKLLKQVKWVGYCDIDLIEDPRDKSIRVIEINARISANVKICYVSGINIAELLLQLYFGNEVLEQLDYKSNIKLRCIHTDFLWLLKSNERFKVEPRWFDFKNNYDQIWSLEDPVPFFTFSIQALLKYRKEMEKRKR